VPLHASVTSMGKADAPNSATPAAPCSRVAGQMT